MKNKKNLLFSLLLMCGVVFFGFGYAKADYAATADCNGSNLQAALLSHVECSYSSGNNPYGIAKGGVSAVTYLGSGQCNATCSYCSPYQKLVDCYANPKGTLSYSAILSCPSGGTLSGATCVTPPTIDSFIATPNPGKSGESVTLSWQTSFTRSCTIDIGSPWAGYNWTAAEDGSMTTNPLPNKGNVIYFKIECSGTDSNSGNNVFKNVTVDISGNCGSSNGGVFDYMTISNAPAICTSGGASSITCGSGGTPIVDRQVSCSGPWTWTCNKHGATGVTASCKADQKIDAACGSADKASHTFLASETTWGTYKACEYGAGSGTLPDFPVAGTSVSWTCYGVGIGANKTCTAIRNAAPVNGTCQSTNTQAFSNATTSWPTAGTPCLAGIGTLPTFPAAGASVSWTCTGSNGGSNAACSASRASVMPGSCGTAKSTTAVSSAPTTGLCALTGGTPSAVTTNASSYDWTCTNGTTVSCSVPRNGQDCTRPCGGTTTSGGWGDCYTSATVACGSLCSSVLSSGYCSNGSWTTAFVAGASNAICNVNACADCVAGSFSWSVWPQSCSGPYGTITNGGSSQIFNTESGKTGSLTAYCNNGALVPNNMTCTANPVNGICQSTNNKAFANSITAWPTLGTPCSAGTGTLPTFPAAGASVSWTCTGSNGGSNATCTASRAGVTPGVCGTANSTTAVSSAPTSGLCAVGGGIPSGITTNNYSYDWTCTNGSAVNCSVPRIGQDCTKPCGGTTTSGGWGDCYTSATVACGSLCSSVLSSRYCLNGSWTSAFAAGASNGSCSVTGCTYSCTGTPPTNNNIFAGVNISGLLVDTPYTYSASDTAAKCEYSCNAYSHRVGTNCDSYVCTGTLPVNATMFANDDVSLLADTAYSYFATDTGTRCQYSCNTGYTWNGLTCVGNPELTVSVGQDGTVTSSSPDNSINCNSSNPPTCSKNYTLNTPVILNVTVSSGSLLLIGEVIALEQIQLVL